MSEQIKFVSEFESINYYERDIFHDLMPYKVKNILLIANLYDALSIERDGKLGDKILGDYYKMNLTAAPRIVNANSYEEAKKHLASKRKFDLVIIMAGINKSSPLNISKKIKNEYHDTPIYLLLNNNADISYYRKKSSVIDSVDNTFVWNGDSSIFQVMFKLLEDKLNLENDTKIGLTRIILLVEDSEKYYSRYLPILYKSVMNQTKRIIDDITDDDDLYKVLKLRLRPKILLATNYEEAISIYNKYRNYLLCLISDVEFKKNNVSDKKAGFTLVKHVKSITPLLPTAIQSSDESNASKAEEYNSLFINKNSDSLLHDIRNFIKYNLGFGDFIFRNNKREIVNHASNMDEFFEKLKNPNEINDESLGFHSSKNHFSLWFRARGEIKLAEKIAPVCISDFENISGLRKHLLNEFLNNKIEKNKGKIIEINDKTIFHESNIGRLSSGALGGKGRGTAFINNLIYNLNIGQYTKDINLKAPKSFIIGTDEYDDFLERNDLFDKIFQEKSSSKIQKLFLKGKLSKTLENRLLKVLELVNRPIAVRSSGLFEDSLMQPFAGVFSTYLLPNNHHSTKVKLDQLKTAVKLVFASVFSDVSRNYIKAVNYKIEEEKMAIVIQEVVGNEYKNTYYPHISGTAQSYNYYPFGKIKPKEGLAVIAVGLGIYVVEGEKAYRFSPAHPTLQNNTLKDLFKNSQTDFYAIDMNKDTIDFSQGETAGMVKLSISEAEKNNSFYFKHCVSTYNPENDTISAGIDRYGPRIVNFSNILKHNYIPLAKTISQILSILKRAMGTPVEIEFALDLNKDENYKASFYILQVKPLIGNISNYSINLEKIDLKKAFLFSNNAMGHGKIENIKDVIYIPPETFNKSKTEKIANQIAKMNRKMMKENCSYVLIGPGRWGTRDKWIGIPVKWAEISKAKVIVETSLNDFPLEASAGSHFFHNVTSMNVGYISVQHNSNESFINWDKLNKQEVIKETKYVKHIRFKENFSIQTDGKKRISVISFED